MPVTTRLKWPTKNVPMIFILKPCHNNILFSNVILLSLGRNIHWMHRANLKKNKTAKLTLNVHFLCIRQSTVYLKSARKNNDTRTLQQEGNWQRNKQLYTNKRERKQNTAYLLIIMIRLTINSNGNIQVATCCPCSIVCHTFVC